MATKRRANSQCKNAQEKYADYLKAYLEVAPIEWECEGNTPPVVGEESNNECKQRKLTQKGASMKRVTKCKESTGEKEASDTSVNLFSNLIDEIVLSIFSYLPRSSLVKCVQVCRKWRTIGYDRILWRQMNLDSRKFTEDGVLGKILHRGVKILRLSKAEVLAPVFSEDDMVGVNEMSSFHDSNNDDMLQLTHLDCSMTKFSENSLSDVLYKCEKLKNLSLEGCRINQSVISATTNNHDLEVLNLALTVGLSHCSVDILTRSCKNLTSVNLSWTNQTRDCIRYLCRCKNLVSLNLAGLRGGINRVFMEMMVMNLKKLKELDFSDVTLQIGSLKLIADNLTSLEKLSISRCRDVRSEQLMDLQNLATLSHLNLFGFLNSAALEQFSECRSDIHINKVHLSPIARPIASTSYEGKLWEQYVGFII